jgi:beta-glucosidase/6-phospho-beta-glucosidase/beta-galactosidase
MNTDNLSKDQQDQLLFMMLIQQHQQIGMMGLGKIKNPATDEMERDLSAAKYAIDTLNVLEKYTSGNLPKELKGYLDQALTTLRLNYADESKKEGNSDAEPKEDA